MLRTAIIDNGSLHIAALQILSGASYVRKWNEFRKEDLQNYDLLILSGSHVCPIENNEGQFEQELQLVREWKKPLLGVCFGFELLVHAWGGTLKQIMRQKGNRDIHALKNDPIFENRESFIVFESHRWVIDSLPAALIPLAKSRDGIEVVRHRILPHYGFQFHPEITGDNQGQNLFDNFMRFAARNREGLFV
jgi:GMP synthase-like glutamine amidotransferase